MTTKRKPIIAGNWKMYKTASEALILINNLKQAIAQVENVEIVVCPPLTALHPVAAELKNTGISVGAQNVYWLNEGAYTGEVSPAMLQDAGCSYVIVGHSERRQYFGETDMDVNRKVKAVLAQGLTPIMCVGERSEERESGSTEKVIKTQTEAGLAGLTAGQAAGLVIAYEPVWAIGTGKTASDADAQQVIQFIRGLVSDMYGGMAAAQVRIQYGGSVKPQNAAGLMRQPDIDGALVGGASLDADSFSSIVKAAAGI